MRMREYLLRVGITELWVLESTPNELNVGGRPCQARMVEGRWWEKPYWEMKSAAGKMSGPS